jgi:parallel beta-helix repeat protein
LQAKALVVTVICLAASTASYAATIDVSPGAGTPIKDAIARASEGDTIRLHAGTYSEGVVVNKPLNLIGDGADVVIIDPRCLESRGISIEADRVTVRGIKVINAGFIPIDVQNRDRVIIRDTIVVQGCSADDYGINVFQSTRVTVQHNEAIGFGDSGIYIGGIAPGANVRAEKNNCHDNNEGFAVENSNGVVLLANTVANNTESGIFLRNSDGVLISHNNVVGNTGEGILLDSDSTDNRVIGNTISGIASDGTATGNCWLGNIYTNGAAGPAGCF